MKSRCGDKFLQFRQVISQGLLHTNDAGLYALVCTR
jgi:hypothetical protein